METKKIVFKKLSKVLSENEMKRITGGYGSGSDCHQYSHGTCGYNGPLGCFCGIDKASALSLLYAGGNWCCDNCGSSSYCA